MKNGIEPPDFGKFDHSLGLNVMHNEEAKYDFLRWRVGEVQSEYRSQVGTRNQEGFDGNVQVFRLLGFGGSREEAVEMALTKRKRNGRA